MSIYIPYFYVIGWTEHDRWYVGARYCNSKRYGIANPQDLMVTYFTSSDKYVHPFIDQHGLPDVIWTYPCKSKEEAQAGELRIMDEFAHFLADDRWINKNKGGSISMSGEIRAKISDFNKGKIVSESTRAKLRGRKHSAETKAKMSASHTGRERSPEHCETLSKRVITDEWRANMSAAQKGNSNRKGIKGKAHSAEANERKRTMMMGNQRARKKVI